MLSNVDGGVRSVELVAVQPAVVRPGVIPVDADTALVGEARGTASLHRRHARLQDTVD